MTQFPPFNQSVAGYELLFDLLKIERINMITLTIVAIVFFSLIITATLMQVIVKLVRSTYKMAPTILIIAAVIIALFWMEMAAKYGG